MLWANLSAEEMWLDLQDLDYDPLAQNVGEHDC